MDGVAHHVRTHPTHTAIHFVAQVATRGLKTSSVPIFSPAPQWHSLRRLCCRRGSTDEIQSASSAGSADCGSTTNGCLFSSAACNRAHPPSTRRLWQGSGAVSAVVQEAARGEAVRAVGAHSSSPRLMVRLVGLLRGATARRESIVASAPAV